MTIAVFLFPHLLVTGGSVVKTRVAIIGPEMETVLGWQNKKLKGTQVPRATELL